jgi:hypothetical protein
MRSAACFDWRFRQMAAAPRAAAVLAAAMDEGESRIAGKEGKKRAGRKEGSARS